MLMKFDASDQEILEYYREHHNPYVTLGSAKKHWALQHALVACRERLEEKRRVSLPSGEAGARPALRRWLPFSSPAVAG